MAGDISKSVNVAINVINGVGKQVGSIVTSFGKITESASKSTKAVSNLNKGLANLKAPAGISALSKNLLSLGKVDSTGVTKLAEGMVKLGKTTFPSFSKINSEIITHTKKVNDLVKAYSNLQTASSKVNLNSFTKNATSANKQVTKLGTSSQKTGASFSQWGYALGSASTGLSKFGTQIYGVTRGFSAVSKEMGLAMGVFTGTFAALFALKGVVSDIVKFDDAIRSAGAVAQASSEQLTQLSDAARAMGESTRYTATDAAGALKALAMTGLDVNESISTLPTVLNLAAAANMDLGESADIVTNIMVGYGKSVGDLPKIADLMTAAFTNSNTSLQELGTALKYVGPVANAAGQSLEETTGILASLANAGYRGSKAGTTLRTAIARLLSPTDKMSKALAHYGIAMDDITNPDGSMKAFSDILTTMEGKSISAGDALTIFGKRAGPGIISLLGQGSEAIAEMNQKIADSEGTALKAAYEMEDGLGGALRKLKSMWEEVSIAIGKTLEQDVQGFIEALTKSLKENKDQIVEVAKAMFTIVGVVGKVVGWIAQFAAANFKLLGSLTAITIALKLLTVQSAAVSATGSIGFFTKLSKISFKSISSGITLVTVALTGFTTALNGNALVSGVSGITTFFSKGFTKLVSIEKGLALVGTSIMGFASALGSAAVAILTFSLPLTALVAIVGGLTAAYLLLNKSNEEIAEKAVKLAKAHDELTRTSKYYLAELKLIAIEYSKDSTDKHKDANQRLRDVIDKVNISLEKKVKLMRLARGGAEDEAEALKLLNEEVEKQKKLQDVDFLKNSADGYEALKGSIEEISKEIKKEEAELDNLNKALEENKGKHNAANGVILYSIEQVTKSLIKRYGKEKQLIGTQKILNDGMEDFVKQSVNAGMSSEEFLKTLEGSGKSIALIDKLYDSFNRIKFSIENATTKQAKYSAESVQQAEERLKKDLEIIASNEKAQKLRENVTKQALVEISVAEMNGVISHEEAEVAKLQATMTAAQKRVDFAKAALDEISTDEGDAFDSGVKAVVAAESAALSARIAILKKISEAEVSAKKKLTKLDSDRTSEQVKNQAKIASLEADYIKDSLSANEEMKDKLKDLDVDLAKDKKKIDDDLANTRRKGRIDRYNASKSLANSLKALETSTEDKLRAIRQRGMTDVEQDADNRLAANEKMKEGLAIVAKARRNNDSEALERGASLINQSSDLYAGLDSEKEATDGVKDASAALAVVEKARYKVKISNIKKGVKEEESAAKKSKLALDAEYKSNQQKVKDEGYDKIKAVGETYIELMKKEAVRHEDVMDKLKLETIEIKKKLQVISQEKDLVGELIEKYKEIATIDGAADIYKPAIEEANNAIAAAESFKGTLSELDGTKVSIDFAGDESGSESKTFSKKVEQIKTDLNGINKDIKVNVSFKSEEKDVKEVVSEIKKEIESVDITLPINISSEDLEIVLAVIEKAKKQSINVTVEVEDKELVDAEEVWKNFINKAVVLTVGVNGYDKLVKAKNMIDKIKSKDVYVTTHTRTVSENADGGLIGPEHYATGGNVFKKLSSRFIASGGGKKDDVPAMLMKGEFVQKVSAVKKYGKDFMSKLNAGLIPTSVARMFNSGGVVEPEHYATGGHVGYGSSMNKLKKKYEEDLLQKRNKVSGSMDFNINNRVSGFDILSNNGIDAVASLRNVIGDSISAFASGGSTLGASDLRSVTTGINSEYNSKISEAKRDGNTELSEILKQEQKDLAELSEKLAEDLESLEEEYNEFKIDTTEDHNENVLSLTSEYNENSDNLEDNHSDVLSNLQEEFLDNIASIDDSQLDSDSQYNEAMEEYQEAKADLEVERKEGELNNAIAHRESITAGHTLGKEISYIYGSKEYREAVDLRGGSMILDKWIELGEKRKGPYNDQGNPDFDFMRDMLGNAFPELKGLLNGDYDDFANNASTSSKISLGSSLSGGSVQLTSAQVAENVAARDNNEIAPNQHSTTMGITTTYATTEYGVTLAQKINDLEKAFNDTDLTTYDDLYSGKLQDIVESENDSKTEYEKEKSDNNDDKAEYQADYDKNTLSENESYNEQKSDYDTSFADNLKSENTSFAESMADRKESYEESVASINDTYADQNETIKIAAKEAKSLKKEETDSEVSSLNTALAEELEKLGISKSNSASRKIFSIFGYNSGGFIGDTDTSVRGKDSILAAVAPQEYVMRASVVKKFGKGFFDSLNNFRIPKFNTGGIVEGGSSLISGAASETVKHALELTINGSQKGQLTGSGPTISEILNDLALAKLRS